MRSLLFSLFVLSTVSAFAADLPATVTAVAPSSDAILAGTAAGVFRSADGGTTWKQVLAGGEDFVVASIAFDPSAPSDVYAATSKGLFRSTDGGATFSEEDLLHGSVPGEIVFDPTHKGAMYVASSDGLYGTADRGATWKPLNPNGSTFSVRGLASRTKPFTLFVVNEAGLFASSDRGATWRALSDERDDLTAVAFQSPSTLHVATNGSRCLRSVDDGKTWQQSAQKLPHFGQFFLAGGAIYASAKDAMWRSDDAGATWSQWENDGTPLQLVRAGKNNSLWGAANDAVMLSNDGGKSWRDIKLPTIESAALNRD